jgi:hypothetical protein
VGLALGPRGLLDAMLERFDIPITVFEHSSD